MSATVSKAGPYFSSGSISFSSLRNTFKEVFSGSISASELRKNTTITDTNPFVPDATENTNISSSTNLKLSQFRNSIKYYYITQSGTDINFDIDTQSWNGNLNKNILKWMYINGTVGSNSTSSAASDFNATAYNLTIDVAGNIYGAGGAGGTSATISGGSGGTALSVTSSGGNNIIVFVRSGAQIYGGGGGGEKGSTGASGASGTCTNYATTSGCGGAPGCPSGYTEYSSGSGGCCQTYSYCCGLFNCRCTACSQNTRYRYCIQQYAVSGGAGGEGGNGGLGRGYNNLSGSIAGNAGAAGGPNNGCGSTDGNQGETGGSGGDWASNGQNTTNTGSGGAAGRAIFGSNYSVTGTINSSTIKGLYLP